MTAASRETASFWSPGRTWVQTPRVKATKACPSRSDITLGFTSFASSRVACVCLQIVEANLGEQAILSEHATDAARGLAGVVSAQFYRVAHFRFIAC